MSGPRHSGFTLIEMVITIVLIGIVAGVLAPLITQSINAYVDTHSRSELQDKLRVSLGRLARELRQASIALTTASGSTLQFTTTTVGGNYVSFNATTPKIANSDCSKLRNQSPSQLERFLPSEPIGTLCVFYPGDLGSLASSARDALIIGRDVAPVSSITAQVSGSPDEYGGALWKVAFDNDVTFTGASASASEVYSLADYQHRISLSGGVLTWQRTNASAINFSGADSGILLTGVTNFTPSVDSATGVVSLSITVSEGSESYSVSEDVYVRN